MRDTSDELQWLAFRDMSVELTAEEEQRFEQRLADDQAAREAVEQTMELSAAIRLVIAITMALGGPTPPRWTTLPRPRRTAGRIRRSCRPSQRLVRPSHWSLSSTITPNWRGLSGRSRRSAASKTNGSFANCSCRYTN